MLLPGVEGAPDGGREVAVVDVVRRVDDVDHASRCGAWHVPVYNHVTDWMTGKELERQDPVLVSARCHVHVVIDWSMCFDCGFHLLG